MNLPNSITLMRLLMVLPFSLLMEDEKYVAIAACIFMLAAVTDWLDGYLARRLNQVTELGQLLDPLVDKVLVAGALTALVGHHVVPAWSVTLLLFREFFVTGLRALEAHHGVIIPAGMMGKLKAALQMVAIIFLMAGMIAHVYADIAAWMGQALYWLSFALSVTSAFEYAWQSRRLWQASEPRI